MSELAYLQVSRVCNQACRFCSNPANGRLITFRRAKGLIDRYVKLGYAGLIISGGEPTLCPALPEIIHYAAQKGIPPRLITNGQKTATPEYLDSLIEAGLQHFHVSIYSHKGEVHDYLTQRPGSLDRISKTLELLGRTPVTVNVNTVLNRHNAGHLSGVVRWIVGRYPFINHFVFNNLDPMMCPSETVHDVVPKLKEIELELYKALSFLEACKKTFRVERVPLCYMTDFAYVSTETRKIVKSEKRAIYFLDDKGLRIQTRKYWHYEKAPRCKVCTLQEICAGLYQMDVHYSSDELCPVFVSKEEIVLRILNDEKNA